MSKEKTGALKRASGAIARKLGYVNQEQHTTDLSVMEKSHALASRKLEEQHQVDLVKVKKRYISVSKETQEYTDQEYKSGINLPIETASLTKTYKNSAWVYSAVFANASHIAAVPLMFFEEKSDGTRIKLDKSHYVWGLFRQPNKWLSGFDLIEGVMTFLELNGNGYIEIEKNQAGKVANMYILLADKMRPIPHRKNRVSGYKYAISNSRDITLREEDVVHFRYFNPESELLGMSPMEAAISALTTDFWSIASTKSLYKNAGRLEGVLETDGSLTDPVYERIRTRWEQSHKGVANRYRTAILEEGLKYKQIQISPKELEFLSQRKFNREEILAVYGVPPIIVGLLEDASWANAREQRFQYWQGTLIPKMKKVESVLNNDLMPIIDTTRKIVVEFDLSVVSALSEDLKAQAERFNSLVTNGILTINEARKRMGLIDKVAWGDTWWYQANLVPYEDGGGTPPQFDEEKADWLKDIMEEIDTGDNGKEYEAGDELPIIRDIRKIVAAGQSRTNISE